MSDIHYHRSKLMDDVRGISMDIDMIERWMNNNKHKGKFACIPYGYVDRIDEAIMLLSKYKGDSTLYHHLAMLLGYYLDELFEIMKERGAIVD